MAYRLDGLGFDGRARIVTDTPLGDARRHLCEIELAGCLRLLRPQTSFRTNHPRRTAYNWTRFGVIRSYGGTALRLG
jgi:hypothetical protein